MPAYERDSIVKLGEGWDNVTYEVNGELVVRFSKEPDSKLRAERIEREARLLAKVRSISPLPVPEPRFAVPEEGCLAYLKLAGWPLRELPAPVGLFIPRR